MMKANEFRIGNYVRWKDNDNVFKAINKLDTSKLNINKIEDGYIITLNTQITPQQKQQAHQAYSQYLDTIFPDSKVKDIVYHGTNKEFDKFKKPSDVGSQNRMIAFADDVEYAKIAGARRTSLKKVISALVNVIKPYPVDKLEAMELDSGYRDEVLNELKEEGFDGFVFKSDDDLATKNFNEILVFEPEQIHILGSKQDIQKAKEFMKNNASKSELKDVQKINDIFNENPELANAVYEALGFRAQDDNLIK